jgi:two-component system, OmpR family, sensor histidine kinase TorS
MKKQLRFLYIEDHAASRMVMKMLLVDMLGYGELICLENTANLEKQLKQYELPFDVIFLDLNLEPYDGIEACAILRQIRGYDVSTIIGLTASMTPADIRRMVEAGFNGAIGKPISHDTFPQYLDRLLSAEPIWEEG